MNPASVQLRELTAVNRESVLALHVLPDQRRFVGTVAGALIEAADHPQANPWYRAIYAGEEPVGFVMIRLGRHPPATGDHRPMVSMEAADRSPAARPGLRRGDGTRRG
jgi:diamine N-acetyltransferase